VQGKGGKTSESDRKKKGKKQQGKTGSITEGVTHAAGTKRREKKKEGKTVLLHCKGEGAKGALGAGLKGANEPEGKEQSGGKRERSHPVRFLQIQIDDAVLEEKGPYRGIPGYRIKM